MGIPFRGGISQMPKHFAGEIEAHKGLFSSCGQGLSKAGKQRSDMIFDVTLVKMSAGCFLVLILPTRS